MGAKPPTCIDPALADGLLTLANHRTRSVDSALASLLEAELGRRGGEKRPWGLDRGAFEVPADFNQPLPDEELDLWERGKTFPRRARGRPR